MKSLIVNANALAMPLADRSVQCVVTSPPYFGLRDYGTGKWMGGDPACSHAPADTPARRGLASSTLDGGKKTTGHSQEGYRVCPRCGAARVDEQIGMEELPDCLGWARGENCGRCYVCVMRLVFGEVWRVLRDDGVVFLNLGDTYRRKNLVGIPWRVALALQADGWILRMDAIWHKTNAMPESVRDRPTRAHEYMFIFQKQARSYYDSESVRVPARPSSIARLGRGCSDHHKNAGGAPGQTVQGLDAPRANVRFGGNKADGYGVRTKSGKEWQPYMANGAAGIAERKNVGALTANLRSVWSLPTAQFAGAHFATYPPELIEPCIKAGSRVGDVVLDPFNGSGTTGMVARALGRHYIGLDLNFDYLMLARERLGLAALEDWQDQQPRAVEAVSHVGLPLFDAGKEDK